jgi:hypothetical protein
MGLKGILESDGRLACRDRADRSETCPYWMGNLDSEVRFAYGVRADRPDRIPGRVDLSLQILTID